MQNETPVEPDHKKQTIELSVFLFLIVPSMILSFFFVKQDTVSFPLTATTAILRDLALIFLIFYFVWNNREPPGAIGLKVKNVYNEIILGAALFIPFFFLTMAINSYLMTHGLQAPKTQFSSLTVGKNIGELLLATLLVIVVAFSEETIFRGYLMLRIRNTTTSSALAVILSSLIFSLGHGYQGSAGAVTVGAMGAIFALIYLWRGNLVAPITMHFLQDFIGIILVSMVDAK